MRFLEVVDLDHEGKPDFTRRRRARFVAHETGKMLGFKTTNPPIDRGARDPQKAADAHLGPALTIELHHLKAGLVTVRKASVGIQRQLPLYRRRYPLPERFDRLVINLVVR